MYRIYKITSPQEEEYCYIGKTKKNLNVRFRKHKHDYKQWLNGNFNRVTSFEIIQYPDATIELVEDDLDELQAAERERYWISQFNTVNICIPGRTKREWHQDNRERMSEYFKQYHVENREIILERVKQYYIDNRERISEYKSQKITCDCGCLVSRSKIAAHKKTINHHQRLTRC